MSCGAVTVKSLTDNVSPPSPKLASINLWNSQLRRPGMCEEHILRLILKECRGEEFGELFWLGAGSWECLVTQWKYDFHKKLRISSLDQWLSASQKDLWSVTLITAVSELYLLFIIFIILLLLFIIICFSSKLAKSYVCLYNETCIRRNRMGPKIFSTLDKFPHYTK
jgi:hypothetical protein